MPTGHRARLAAIERIRKDLGGGILPTQGPAGSGPRAARNVVLLGDPQQLEQPTKGAHPDGADVAALVHVLGKDRATLADDQGLFLDRTWRLHPAICAFTSELYYEGRLHPVDGLERQRLEGNTPFAGAGLFLVEVPHEGNQSRSNEEIDAVEGIVERLLARTRWTDQKSSTRSLAPSDILVVAPYNAQVSARRRHRRRQSRTFRGGLQDAGANAVGKRALPVQGNGGECRWTTIEKRSDEEALCRTI